MDGMAAKEAKGVRIVVDDRERAGGVAEALRRVSGRPVEVRRLAVGDILVGERVVIERKAAADFVASLLDGRLERQLDALLSAKGRPALVVIEGDFNPTTLAGMAAGAVRQAILSIELDRRVPVLRSRGVEDTARWVVALAEREEFNLSPLAATFCHEARGGLGHPAGHRGARRRGVADPQQVQIAALRRVPGIGAARAAALIGHFGSLQALISADLGDLATVAGIGPGLARAIRAVFTGPGRS